MGVFDPRNQQGGNGQPQRGRGIGGRLILGVIIALFAWFSYMMQVQENPITGEKQHVSMSPDQEIALGLKSAPQMAREMGGEVPSTDPKARVVQALGQYLVVHSDAKKSPWEFQFHLLADPETVNAFALPGGQIFITLGLLDKLQTEAELAGVLGHEMGHVIERHSAQQMAKSNLGILLVVAVGTAASSDQSMNASNPVVIAAMVNQMIQLRYSRKDESQADLWGVKIMEQTGFDPRAMVQVMEVLKAAGGKGGHQLAIFQTHPDPDLRIKQINEYLAQHPPPAHLTEGENLEDMYRKAGNS